jgi:hypothetical protein
VTSRAPRRMGTRRGTRHPTARRDQDRSASPTATTGLDEPEDEPTEAEGHECGSDEVEPARARIPTLGRLGEEEQGDGRERHVEEERPAPGVSDEPSTEERTYGGRDPAESRPGADRLARSAGPKDEEMRASAPGMRSAPPIPCTVRARMSQDIDGAHAQTTETPG